MEDRFWSKWLRKKRTPKCAAAHASFEASSQGAAPAAQQRREFRRCQPPGFDTLEGRIAPAGIVLDANYGNLPLHFEPNVGQTDAQVRFLTRGSGYSVFLTSDAAVLNLTRPTDDAALAFKLIDSNPNASAIGEDLLPGISNYFVGDDPSQWRTGIAQYGRVSYHDVYPGVDLVYYGTQQQLEYDFVVAPGTAPEQIRLSVDGADALSLDDQGNLIVQTPGEDVIQRAPIIYQTVSGVRQDVAGRFVLLGENRFGFQVDAYDTNLPLTIDPIFGFGTYLGGSATDDASGPAVDGTGNVYVTGSTSSNNFPTTFGGGTIAASTGYVVKLNSTGTALVYSTFVGGTAGTNSFDAIAVDASGNVYLTGDTSSSTFPTTAGAPQTSRGGSDDGFVAKLNPTGTALVYSTYLGGSAADRCEAIVIDALGNAYVTGETFSSNFPTTAGAFQTARVNFEDAFVAKLNPTGTGFGYVTLLGGNERDKGNDLALDGSGNVFVTGITKSTNFPVTAGAFQTTAGADASSDYDGFVAKVAATGSALVYATYLGGNGNDQGHGIAVDGAGDAYVTGFSRSANFPVTAGAYQTSYGDSLRQDGYVAKLNPTGTSLIYNTYLGGNDFEDLIDVAIDELGNAYVVGVSSSTNFPTTADAFQSVHAGGGGDFDVILVKLNATGSALGYSTYYGGNTSDHVAGMALRSGIVYFAGRSQSPNLPTTPDAFQPTYGGSYDGYVAKFVVDAVNPSVVSVTRNSPVGPYVNASSVEYVVSFSEPVDGLDGSDFVVTHTGSVSSSGASFVALSDRTYRVTVSAITGDGTLRLDVVDDDSIVSVATGLPLGGAGAGNGAVQGEVYSIDHTGPSLSVTQNPPPLTQSATADFAFTGSDPTVGGVASGLDHFNYQLDGGSVLTSTGSVTFTGLADGGHTFDLTALDNAGNATSTSVSWTVDATAPTLAITPNGTTTNASTFAFTFAFSESVTGFNASDVTVTNGTKGTFTALGGSTYRLIVTPTGGTVTATVAANACQDGAGNGNGSATATVTSGRFGPSLLSIARAVSATAVNTASVDYVVTFDRPVFGVDPSDFATQTAGTLTSNSIQVAGSGSSYVVTVGGLSGNGTVALNFVDDRSIRDGLGQPLKQTSFGVFLPQATFATGNSPFSIAQGDMNGDGNADLVVVNFGPADNTVGVLLGNGNGTFAPQQTLQTGTGPIGVVVGDFNRDGRLDIAALTQFSSQISVFFGNGNGTFKAKVGYGVGPSPTRLTAADLNFDGNLDLLVANHNGNSVGKLFGHQNGTFTAQQTIAVAASPDGIAVGDVDGDGFPDDLVVTSHVSDNFGISNSVLTVLSGGSFVTQTFHSAPNQYGVELADVTGDGRADLLLPGNTIESSSPGYIYVYVNRGGRFDELPSLYVPVNPGPAAVHALDLNGDGKLDVVAATAGSVSVALGNGNGTFKPTATYAAGIQPLNFTWGDFNGDGQTDLALGNLNSASVSVYLQAPASANQSGPAYVIDVSAPSVTINSQPPVLTGSVTATFTFSGNDALVGGVASGIDHFEYRFDGGGFATATSPLTLDGLSSGSHTFEVRSVDGAGNVSTPVSHVWQIDTTAPVLVVTPNGTTTSASTFTFTFAFSKSVTGFDTTDVTVTNGTKGAFSAVDGSTYRLVVTPVADGAVTASVAANACQDAAGNGNNSSAATVTIERYAPNVVSIARATPTGPLANANSVTYAVTYSKAVTGVDAGDFTVVKAGSLSTGGLQVFGSGANYLVTIADVAGDGSLTLKLVDDSSIRDLFGLSLVSAGSAVGLAKTTYPGIRGTTIPVADFNSDGKLDVAVFNQFTSIDNAAIGLGNGDGTIQPLQFMTTLSPLTMALTADMNGDGNADLVFHSDVHGLAVLLGNGNATFKAPQATSLEKRTVIAVADVDGDGKQDVVAASYGGIVSVLLGNGNGTFKPRITTANGRAGYLSIADFDNDGKPDLVTSNGNDNNVSVFRSNGNGTFKPRTTISHSSAGGLAAGDVDGDGNFDLVTTNQNDRVAVFLGNGDATFKAPSTFASANQPLGVMLADLNGDGRLDVVTWRNQDAAISVMLGLGNGSLETESPFAALQATGVGALSIADLSGDGRPDLAVQGNGSGFAVLVNQNKGSLTGQTYIVDQTAPTATITRQAPVVSRVGAATFAFTGDDPTVHGVTSGIDRFEFRLDGGAWTTAVSPVSVFGLAEGGHVFQLRAIDVAGNASALQTVDWTIDPEATLSVGSIVRTAPAGAFVSSAVVTYKVLFNGPVTGVDLSDFGVATTGTIAIGPIVVSDDGGGDVYSVTIDGISGDGTLRLDVMDDDSILAIVDNVPLGGAGLGNGAATGASSTIDRTKPVATISSQPLPATTSSSAAFAFSGNDPAAGGVSSGVLRIEYKLDGGNFVAATNGEVTFPLLAAGAHVFEVRALDVAGNVSDSATYSWTIDRTWPTVTSIARTTPPSTATNAGSVIYVVTFSEPVTGVDAGDFSVASTGAATYSGISQVSGSGAVYSVTIDGVAGNGTIGLNLVDNRSIRDAVNHPLGSSTSTLLQPQLTTQTNLSATNVAVADFDSDGTADVALGGDSNSRFGIVHGNGNGTFGPRLSTALTGNANFIAAADVNGDGFADVLIDGSGSSSLFVLLGNGNGTFKPQQTFALGDLTKQLLIGDLNGDGKLDVVVPSQSNRIDVLLGNGNGTFKPRATFGTIRAESAVLADVSGDGKLDVVVASYQDQRIAVLIGIGDGTLGPQTTFASNARSLAIGDVDNDLKPDLVAVGGTALQIYRGNNDGTFKPPITYSSAANNLNSVAIADFNGDGNADLALGKNALSISIRRGNGDGTFRAETSFASYSSSTFSVSTADFDNDGRPDIVIDSSISEFIGTLLNGVNGNTTGQAYLVDTTAPTIAFTTRPPANSISSSAAFAFSGSDPTVGGVASGVNHLEWRLDGGGWTTATSASLSGLTNGSHSFEVRTYDNVGNVGQTSYTWTVNTTSPLAVLAIDRTTPAGPNTNGTSVVFTVTFNDLVTGVNSADFAVIRTGSVTSGSASVSAVNGHTYNVTVSNIVGDGTLRLDLLDDDSIKSSATGQSLGGPGVGNGAAQGSVFGIDRTGPTTTIAAMPAAVTGSHSATFDLTAVDPVVNGVSSGVGVFQYKLDTGSFVQTAVPFTLNGLNVGSHQIQVRAVDAVGNIGAVVSYSWVVAPNVQSITRSGSSLTSAASVAFTVTFDASVTGVDVSDFAVVSTNTATGAVSQVTGSGTTYTVTVSSVVGDGSLGLNLVDDDSIRASSGAAPLGGPGLGNGNLIGASFSIDNTGPTTAITSMPPAVTDQFVALFNFASSDPVVGGVSAGLKRVEYSYDGGPYTAVTQAFTLSAGLGTHVVLIRGIDNVDNVGARASYTWIVDLQPPAVSSIVRAAPTAALVNASAVTYTVTFSEAVTGVDADDFVVPTTGAATTAGVTTVSGSGAVYTVTVGSIVGSGTVGLTLVNNGSIRDLASRLLTTPGGADIIGPTYVVDQAAPNLTIVQRPPSESLSNAATFVFTATDPVAGSISSGVNRVEYQLDGGATVVASGPVTFTGLGNGPHLFLLRAFDNAGNVTQSIVNWIVDTTAPLKVIAIDRTTPPNGLTNALSVVYTVSFNDSVTGVDSSDFVVATTGTVVTGAPSFAAINGYSFSVTVSLITGDGKLRLDVADNDSIVSDTTGLPLGGAADGTAQGSLYSIDHTGPTTTIVAMPPLATASRSATFDFTAVDPDQDGVSSGVDHFEYRLDLSGSFVATSAPLTLNNLSVGAHVFQVRAVDNLGNVGASVTYSWTIVPVPHVQSIVRNGASITNASNVEFSVTFDAPVSGVDTADFALAMTGSVGAVVSDVSGGGAAYVVTVSAVTGDGTLGVNLVDNDTIFGSNGVAALAGAGSGNGDFTGPTYSIDHTGPLLVSIKRAVPTGSPTSATSVTYAVTFDEPVVGVDEADFEIVSSGSATATSLQVTGSGATYLVVVGGIAGSGSLRLDLLDDDDSIADLTGNLLANRSSPDSFEASQTFASVPGASSVTTADLDGDGALDVIETNSGANVVSVMLGAGNGELGTPQTFSVGAFPVAVVVADVDADGTPDLVVVDRNGAGVSLLLGNGDGAFQDQQSFGTGARPTAAALADVNGDGHVDVIAVNAFSNNAAVLLGNGDGAFQTLRTFVTGGLPTAVAVGHVNADAHLDIVVVNQASQSISVLRGVGGGNFQTHLTFAVGAMPSSLSLADVNNDGKLDVVVANTGDGTIGVLLGNGNGTFAAQQAYVVGSLPRSMAVVDVSGDGHLDGVVVSGGAVSVLRGIGSGAFLAPETFAAGVNAVGLSLGDVNGDGATDVLIASESGVGSVLFGTPAGGVVGQSYVIDPSAPLNPLDFHALTPAVTGVGAAQVLDVVPFVGPTSGGTTVVLSGVNFLGVTAVRFGGVIALSYVVHSATRITAVAPPGSSGLVDVTVTNIAGTSSTGTSADDYTYAAPAIVSVAVNGGAVAARNRFGKTPDVANQSSVVVQLLVTFNQRVTLDANAFQIASLAANLTASGATPSSANVAVIATGVEETGDARLGYEQYVLTFAPGAGVNAFDHSTSGGAAFTTLQDGFWNLLTTGSKIHVGADTAADRADAFWSLFGVFDAGDIVMPSDPSAGPEAVHVDGLALNHVYAAFGSRNDDSSQAYSPAFDWDLDGDVDGIDLGRLYANFGAIWHF